MSVLVRIRRTGTSAQNEIKCTAWVYVPIGNPFGLMCGTNPGGHGVPVYTMSGPPGPAQYQAELFTKSYAMTMPGSTTPGIERELTRGARYSLQSLLSAQGVAGCEPSPYPLPDPYRTATQPTDSPVRGEVGWYAAACSSKLKCGGCFR